MLIVAAGLVPRAVPADDYLDAIEVEAAKLSEEPAAAKPEAEATDKAAPASDDPQARFEQELKGRSAGAICSTSGCLSRAGKRCSMPTSRGRPSKKCGV